MLLHGAMDYIYFYCLVEVSKDIVISFLFLLGVELKICEDFTYVDEYFQSQLILD